MTRSLQMYEIARHGQVTPMRPSTREIVQGYFAGVSLFAYCSKRELRLVARLARVEDRTVGTKLTVEGKPGSEMYVVLQGKARVHRNGRRVADIGAGAVVGELSLLTKSNRNATVVATTPIEIAVLGRKELDTLIEGSPGFSRKLIEGLAKRVQELDARSPS